MTKEEINKLKTNLPPLAERIRPQTLADFIGQSSLINDNSLLTQTLKKDQLFSMIFWGPPGTGKTTLAKIIAQESNAKLFAISAVSSGVKDVRKIIATAKELLRLNTTTLLFIDEIHRFSKSQQDALLHAVEDGSIILIGATTENPSFEVISPLLSRCKILTLNSFTEYELHKILNRAIKEDIILSQKSIKFDDGMEELLILSSGGDARKMLNTLELAVSLHQGKSIKISQTNLEEALQQKNIIYDKSGDYHYDTISAFIKSVRGSDPDASVYWLAIMLEAGEKPEFIARRLIILASEDIGNADPYAVMLANSAMQSVHSVGMPESMIILGQVTTYLASAPKSNAANQAIQSAMDFVKKYGTDSVPLHLRNAPTKLMKDLDYGKGYQYPHSKPDHFVKEKYFPDSFDSLPSFYNPTTQGREKFLKERLIKLWKDRFK